MKRGSEYDTFDHAMRRLVRVSHGEIKSKLDAEKAAKKRAKKPASRRASGAGT